VLRTWREGGPRLHRRVLLLAAMLVALGVHIAEWL